MFTLDEKTTLVGITDLRTKAKRMLGCLRDSRVILTDRNKPRAVVIDYESYQRMKELVEMAEESMDSAVIRERTRGSKGQFLTHRDMLRRLKLKSAQ